MTSKEDRTRVLGQLLSMNFFGNFVGSLALGVMLAFTGYELVFGAVITVTFACVPTTVLCMRESVADVKTESSEVQSGCIRSEVFRRTIIFCLRIGLSATID